MSPRIIIVTGANRGLGLATASKLSTAGDIVYFASRHPGSISTEALGQNGVAVQLDVTDEDSCQKLVDQVIGQHGRIDVLVNNAGVLIDPGWQSEGSPSIFDADKKTIRDTMEVNVYGLLYMTQLVAPHMRDNGYGRIVNISSGMGQLVDMEGNFPAYRISKTSVNVVTKICAEELKSHPNIKVNCLCPGWVQTDMGGANAALSIDEGIAGILWAANLPEDGPSGGFFRHGEAIPW